MDNYNNGQNQYGQYDQYNQQSNQQYNYHNNQQYNYQNNYQNNQQNNQQAYANYSGVSDNVLVDNPMQANTYMNPYNAQFQPVKPKKKKGLLIAGIITLLVAIIAAVVVCIIVFSKEKFNIDDFDKVNKACEEVFGVTLDKTELNSNNGTGDLVYRIKTLGNATGYVNEVKYTIHWFEFDNEESAKTRRETLELEYDRILDKILNRIENLSIISTSNKIEWSYTHKDRENVKTRNIYVMNDKYGVEVQLYGNAEQTDKLYKSFMNKIK